MSVINVSPNYIRNIISEEKHLLLEHQRYKRMIISEGYRLKSEGHSIEAINEGLMDIIMSLGSQFVKSFKHDIADYLISKLTFLNPTGFLAQLIGNVVEEVDVLNFKKYLSPGGCEELTDLILRALTETGIEPLADGFMSGLGVADPSSRFYVTIRETIADFILKGEIAQKISETISGWICNLDVSAIVDVFKGTVSDEPGAPDSDEGGMMDRVKDIFSKTKESGVMDKGKDITAGLKDMAKPRDSGFTGGDDAMAGLGESMFLKFL